MASAETFRDERSWLVRLGEALTRDRGRRFTLSIRWLQRPAAVLAMAAATALTCGLFIHPRALILAMGIATTLAVGAAWPWISTLGISGEIGFWPSRTREGVSTTARLAIRNLAPWNAWGLSIRADSPLGGGEAPGLAVAVAKATTEVSWPMSFDRRGVHPGDGLRIECGFPFGLVQMRRPLSTTNRVIVWPRTFPVGPIPESAGSRESDGAAVANRAGATGDAIGVRPYRRGDSIRRIHWPQSARHGALIICEQESRSTPEVQIVIDVHPDAHVGEGGESSLEWAVRVAASFAEGWTEAGALVDLVFGEEAVAAGPGSIHSRKSALLDALARLRSDDALTLSEILASPSCSRRPSGLRLVVATDRSDRSVGPSGSIPERWVLLAADAFSDAGERSSPPPPIRPWIWIDGPLDVAGRLRRSRMEVDLAR